MESLLIALIFGLCGYGYMKSAIAIFIVSLPLGIAQLNYTALFFLYNALIYYYYGAYGVAQALTISCIYIFIFTGLLLLMDLYQSSNKYACDMSYKKLRFIESKTSYISICYIYACSLFDALLIKVALYIYSFRQLTKNITGFSHLYKAYDKMVALINKLYEFSKSIKTLYGLNKMLNSQKDNNSISQKQQLIDDIEQSIETSVCDTDANTNASPSASPDTNTNTNANIDTNTNNQTNDCSDSDSLDECDDIPPNRVNSKERINMDMIGNFGLPDINKIMEMESQLTDDQKKQRDRMAEKMMESIFGKKSAGLDFEKMFSMFDDMKMNKKNA